MKNCRVIFVLLALVFLPALGGFAAEQGDPVGGARLAEQLREMTPSTNSSWTGVLVRKFPDYSRTKAPVSCQVFVKPDEWSATYNVESTEHNRAQKLTIIHRENGKVDYFLWVADEDGHFSGQPERLRNEETLVPFANSDFYVSDFGMEFFQWPTQFQLKGQMRSGRPCYVLDSVSPRPDSKGYYRVRSWIDKEYMGLLQANAYDVNGKLLKEFRTGSVTKDASGTYQLKDMEISDRRTDTETQLRFDIER